MFLSVNQVGPDPPHGLEDSRKATGYRPVLPCEMWTRLLLAFQNHARHCQARSVRQGEGRTGSTDPPGNLRSPAVEPNRRSASRFADNLDFQPVYPSADPRPKGFGGCLLGGKARGQALSGVALSKAVGLLRGGIDAIEEAASVAIHGVLDAANLNHIDSRTNDHAVFKLQHFVNAVDKAVDIVGRQCGGESSAEFAGGPGQF